MRTPLPFHKLTYFYSRSLQSSGREQLYQSDGYFAPRIKEIMQEGYVLTRDDYLHSRSWTQGINETTLEVAGESMTLRDVGGDELNRANHWGKAIEDSVCSMFVVALPDYTKTDSLTNTSKFWAVRELMWSYLVNESVPKFILLLNKQDLFVKSLEQSPLHECGDFCDVSPRAADESIDTYAKRCEKEVVIFFNRIPGRMKTTKKYLAVTQCPTFDNADLTIKATFVTQATDQTLFRNIKIELCDVIASITAETLSVGGF